MTKKHTVDEGIDEVLGESTETQAEERHRLGIELHGYRQQVESLQAENAALKDELEKHRKPAATGHGHASHKAEG